MNKTVPFSLLTFCSQMLIKPFSGICLKYYFICLPLLLLGLVLPLKSVYVKERMKEKGNVQRKKNMPVSSFEGINKL